MYKTQGLLMQSSSPFYRPGEGIPKTVNNFTPFSILHRPGAVCTKHMARPDKYSIQPFLKWPYRKRVSKEMNDKK